MALTDTKFTELFARHLEAHLLQSESWSWLRKSRKIVPGRCIEFIPVYVNEVYCDKNRAVGAIYYRLEWADENTFRMFTPTTRMMRPCTCGKCDLCGRGAYLSK